MNTLDEFRGRQDQLLEMISDLKAMLQPEQLKHTRMTSQVTVQRFGVRQR